ncbi:MAG: tRNA (adenosine(37)-N6)-dimethylallyltransferase MiaA [Actinomycetes bacterium]
MSPAIEQGQRAHPPVVAIVGPTAVGKSELSLDLAQRFNGEVINADSMQLYRGMDIGTAKLPASQRRGVRHHLLDIWELDHTATVAEFQALARAAIDAVRSRNRLPILVGGSGLYVNAVVDDLRFPGTDAAVRQRWEEQLRVVGAAALHEQLAHVDPAAAAAIEPGNGRRIVRALEVIEITGQPFAAALPFGRPFLEATVIGMDIDRSLLDSRIADRVERMWDGGLLDEVVTLADRGLADAPTASRAIGYSQALAVLSGRISEGQAKVDQATATRRFARRQLSWFHRDPRVVWLTAGGGSGRSLVDEAAAVLVDSRGR